MLNSINKPFDEITQKDIDKYVQYCNQNKKRNGNALRFWSIQKFVKWTERNDLKIPIINPIDAGKQALTTEDFDKIIQTLPKLKPLHRVVGYALIDTIRRPNEIKNIKIKNIQGDRLTYEGKTGTKYCIMSDRLQQAIKEYIEKERPISQKPEDNEYLILCDYGQFKGMHPKTRVLVDRIVKEIAMYSKIEIPPKETACSYLLKRTTITEQLDQYPPKYVQFQAGHIKPETTMKYQRPRDEDIKRYINLFEHKSEQIKRKPKISNDKSF
jgi:integrase